MNTSNLVPPPGPPRRPWVAISLFVALLAVAGNLIGYVVYLKSRPAESEPAPVAVVTESGELERKGRIELARKQLSSGAKALQEEKYEKALVYFENAKDLDPELEEVDNFLALARSMSEKAASKVSRAPRPVVEKPEPTPAPEPVRKAPARTERREVRREPRRRTESAPSPGRLFVTTEPEGLLVEVDGEPSGFSPLRLELAAGEHAVRLRRGETTLLERKVTIRAGDAETLDATLKISEPESGGDLADDKDLDLLALVGREERKRAEPAARAAPTERSAAPSLSARPRLLVVGGDGAMMARTLSSELSSLSVEAVSGVSKDELRRGDVGAVMATPSVLRGLGLSPALRPNQRGGDYVAVSLTGPVRASELPGRKIGMLDALGARGAPMLAARLLGVRRPPSVRRVRKVEDLMSSLQLGVVDAVIVERGSVPELKRRTERELYVLGLEPAQSALQVALVEESEGRAVESALRTLSDAAQQTLGVKNWTR